METARFRIKYPIIETCFTNLKAINMEIYISWMYSFTRKNERKKKCKRNAGWKESRSISKRNSKSEFCDKKGSFKEWKV